MPIQTVFIICALSIVGGINFLIVKSGTHLIDIILKDDEIQILTGDKEIYRSKYADIKSYNTYYFINKRGGYIVRLNDRTQSFCSLLTWVDFGKITAADWKDYNTIKDTFSTKFPDKKKMTGVYYLLKILSATPYVFFGNSGFVSNWDIHIFYFLPKIMEKNQFPHQRQIFCSEYHRE
ncbi:hypothetical protein K7A41_19220 [Sphingobacterium sp. InxBP1]|uniref:hypothetical protein n=1 Tax=Sphingobacterium sp. InxBP1 TaxID=2870328 RepID=UPI002243551F|nr:hypothetical protein [Sphingobacterium sp. InxBP1]MCW8313366.1 hypothetical protein [Sphingobacterium sp. InxBP1]